MRIENSLRPAMLALTATVAIVCGSWHDLATGSVASAAANTLDTPRSVPASVRPSQQLELAAMLKTDREIQNSNMARSHETGSAGRVHTSVPALPPMIEVATIERPRTEPRPEAELLAPVRLDSSMPSIHLPPAPSESVAPPPTPRVGMFARVKPTLVADSHATSPVFTGSFGAASVATNHAGGVVSGTSFGTNVVYTAPRGDSRRVVESARFANSAFGDEQVALSHSEPIYTPPVVESEQQARYTAEAEQARIQGEVTLKVRFLASGQVEVIGVVSGLGHGLDEEARHVAESIRFKPALRNGQPVDRTTLIHVTFQLV